MTDSSPTLATYSKISIKIVGQFSFKYSKPSVCIIAGKKKEERISCNISKKIQTVKKHLEAHLNLENSFSFFLFFFFKGMRSHIHLENTHSHVNLSVRNFNLCNPEFFWGERIYFESIV